jgi:acyl-CoA thioester hydrolase
VEEKHFEPTFRGVVYPNYIDQMGHMNVQYYVHLFDQATWSFFESAGLSFHYFAETTRGMAALEQHLTYRREVFAGTVITITTQILKVTGKTVQFLHTMTDSEGVVATCKLVAAHIDRAVHKSETFPPDILARLHALQGSEQ